MLVSKLQYSDPLVTGAKMNSKKFALLAASALLVGGCTEEIEIIEMGDGPNAGLYGGWIVSEAE